jgi:hypothetical protein
MILYDDSRDVKKKGETDGSVRDEDLTEPSRKERPWMSASSL